MRINKRLKQIGDLVDANSFCLDIGCDHAFLDIYLVKLKKNITAVASDIKEGPINIARENIKKEGFSDKIEVRLGNGLDTYSEKIDTAIISGMGGRNMIGIFKNNLAITKKLSCIIVSPNNHQEDLKRFLCRNGFYIDNEVLVKEGKFIYQIIKFKKGKKHYTGDEYFFGPVLLKKKGKLFYEYYEREAKTREILIQLLPKNYRFKKFITKLEIKKIKKIIDI